MAHKRKPRVAGKPAPKGGRKPEEPKADKTKKNKREGNPSVTESRSAVRKHGRGHRPVDDDEDWNPHTGRIGQDFTDDAFRRSPFDDY